MLVRQFGVVSRAQLIEIGMSPSAIARLVRNGQMERMYQNVYRSLAVPSSWKQKLMAVCLWAGQEVVVSHRSAAKLWEFDGIEGDWIELTMPRPRRPPSADVILHCTDRMPNCDIALVGRMSVTTPTRTLIDLGAVVDEETVEIALDCALRRGMTSIPRLRRRIADLSARGRRGVPVLRDLVADRDPVARGPESALETRTRRVLRILRRAHIPLPVCQFIVGPYRVDFAYPAKKIAIEADSYGCHSSKAAWARDLARRNYLTARGWLVLHFTWDQVTRHPEEVVAEVRRALASRAG